MRASTWIKFIFVAKSSKMEDWEIPEQDDFESRYADELEMLDDLDEEGKFSVGFFLVNVRKRRAATICSVYNILLRASLHVAY